MARGKQLGTPDPAGAVKRMGKALKAKTSQFAANVLPIIREIQGAGHASCNAIAGQLNARKASINVAAMASTPKLNRPIPRQAIYDGSSSIFGRFLDRLDRARW